MAILGVLDTNIPGVLTRGLTWAFDAPSPYTYPIFRKRNGSLESDWPDVRSLQQFRECLYDDVKWAQFTAKMAPSDPFFDPFLFRSYPADASVTFRLLRKAWGQYRKQLVISQTHTKAGFVPGCQAMQNVSGILEQFASDARSEGCLPIVVLLETLGYSGHLEAALGPFLRSKQIPYLATGTLFPANDGRSFVPDGHFTPANNEKVVRALLDMIHRLLDEKQKQPEERDSHPTTSQPHSTTFRQEQALVEPGPVAGVVDRGNVPAHDVHVTGPAQADDTQVGAGTVDAEVHNAGGSDLAAITAGAGAPVILHPLGR